MTCAALASRLRLARRRESGARSCCSRRPAWRGARATRAASDTRARRGMAAAACLVLLKR
jgi:hypothetical protein